MNIFKDEMQRAQLFGKPVLATGQPIPRETVPDGWYCYDMRGTSNSPGSHAELVDRASFHYSGTVLSPVPLKRPATKARRIREEDYIPLTETMDLKAFCEEYGLDVPDNPIKFVMRPASSAQAPYPSPRRKRQGSLIPPRLLSTSNPLRWASMWLFFPVRIDFGHDGGEFWHTWQPRGPEGLNTPEFKGELGEVVDQLRRGVLKDFSTMLRWCHLHGGEIAGGACTQNYGYVVETDQYRYCLRCNPVRGDYQAYLTCFDLRQQELSQDQEQDSGPMLGGMG